MELTDIQRAFVAGVYVLNPNMPAGLPVGDKAVLATVDETPNGEIFFVDGDVTCSPMEIPKQLIDMIVSVGAGAVNHAPLPPTN